MRACFTCVCAVDLPTVEESCADVPLVARSAGHTKVSIAYEHDVFELRATVTVAAYRPLKAILLLYLNLVFLCSEKNTAWSFYETQ